MSVQRTPQLAGHEWATGWPVLVVLVGAVVDNKIEQRPRRAAKALSARAFERSFGVRAG
jgi:hypothetical protein